MIPRSERGEWLRASQEALKQVQAEYAAAVEALRRAEAAVRLAEAVLEMARQDLEKATAAVKEEGA